MRPAFAKFEGILLRCPKCGGSLRFDAGCFRCGERHSYDVSAKGYVNLIPGQKALTGYTEEFFRSRRAVMEAGFYAHILAAVRAQAEALQPQVIADIGCGEGCYARALADFPVVFGLDAAAPAVREAAAGGNPVRWLVGDLTNIPLPDASVDLLLNIFTPANYAEFARVLRPGGTLLKVIPAPAHLHELRAAFGTALRAGEDYDNARVRDWFAAHCSQTGSQVLSQTLPVTPALRSAFLRMTPLAFGLTPAQAEEAAAGVTQITVAAELLCGRC